MVLSGLHLTYFYYLEISLTVLQNYRITAFVNFRLTSLNYQKVKETTITKWINKSLKKHHRYIYWVFLWLGKIQNPRPLRVNVKQKPFRQIYAHSGIIRHIREFFRHIHAYLEACLTLTYLKLWYIQNPNIFRIRSIFRTPTYSQPCYIQNPAILRTLAYSKSEAYAEPVKHL